MSKKRGGRGFKYPDAFKQQMVVESLEAGATVPIVSKRHGVPTSRIYAWRQDERFQSAASETPGFAAVELTDAATLKDVSRPQSEARIEITLENGRKLSISDGVDVGFVLELARGLAA